MSWNNWSQQSGSGDNWSQQGGGGGSWGGQQSGGAQQNWGGAAAQQQQSNTWQQPQQAQQPAAAAPQQQASSEAAKALTVQGCQHPTIGSIVRGSFTSVTENHAKPVYKKDQQVSGLDVMIYYWDERDGPSQAGWWFGPKVGGEQVWAYHPETKTPGPPKEGWQVPYGGPVDASFIVNVVQAQQPQQWNQQPQQPQQQQQSGGKGNQQQSWGQQQSQPQQSWGKNQQSQGNQQSWGGNQQSPQSWGNQQSKDNQQSQSWGDQSQSKQSWGTDQQSWGQQSQQQQQQQSQPQQTQQQQSWGNNQQNKGKGKVQSWGTEEAQGNQQSQGWNAQPASQDGGWKPEQTWNSDWNNQAAAPQLQDDAKSEMEKQKEAMAKQREAQAEAFRAQQQARQEETMKKKKEQEELAKKKVEEQAKKMAEWKKKIEEEKAKKLEEANKKAEEIRLKKEADEKKRMEQRATFAIKRVIQRIRTATPETFDTLEGELHAEVDKELPNCGEQAEAMKEDIEKGLEQGRTRVEQIKETRRAEEEKKAKAEAEKKEKEEKAKNLVEELNGLMTTAEEQVKSLQEAIKSSEIESPDNSPEQVKEVSKITDEAEETGRASIRTCFEFMKENGSHMKAPEADAETKGALSKLLVRMNELQKNMEVASGQAKAAKEKAEKKAAALAKTKEFEDTVKKYDKDKDGALSATELTAYAKGEFGITLSKDLVNFAMMSLVEADSKGVKANALPRLRSIVGISKELARDKKRLEFRLEKEKVIGGMKDALKAKVKDAAKFVKEADTAVKDAESEIAGIAKRAKVMPPEEMISLATKSDKVHEAAKVKYQKAPSVLEKAMQSIDPKYEKDLKAFISKESKKLQSDLRRMELRLNRVSLKTRRYREQALTKELESLLTLREKAAKVIRYNQSSKKLSFDDLFQLFDDGSGNIGESEFLAFFDTADTEIRHLTMGEAEEKPAEEEEKKAEEAKDGEEKTEGEEKEEKEEEKKQEAKDETLIETIELSKEDLMKVFAFLSDMATSLISKDDFFPFVKKYMKVVMPTAMTESAEIGTSKPARKLDAGEVVEVIEGPVKDLAKNVSRIRCKALKDGLEGWLSVCGNQGTVFCEEKAHGLYKVLKKSFLTDSFELVEKADDSKIVKAGMIMEVREEPKKEETSGQTRMKGRVRSQDHLVGWMTTKDKDGKILARPY